MKQRIAFSAVLLSAFAVAFPALTLAQAPYSGHTTNTDREFVAQAVKANEEEIAMADPQRKVSDPAVRSFAQTVISDHNKSLAQLETLAHQYNIKYPQPSKAVMSAPPPKQYMQNEVTDHKKAIALYENEAKNGGNQALRSYAAHTIPTLQKHLDMAEHYVATH